MFVGVCGFLYFNVCVCVRECVFVCVVCVNVFLGKCVC